MFTVARHPILFKVSSRILLKCVHTGASASDFDTGINGFERNKKAFRQNSLPSYFETLTHFSKQETINMYRGCKEVIEEMVTLSFTNDIILATERTREMLEYVLPWSPVVAPIFLMVNKFYVERRRGTKELLTNEKEHDKLSFKLACGIDMLNHSTIIIDDLMDGSEARQGLPCWHTVSGVGLHAINDSALLTYGGYLLLNTYFGQKDYFSNLMRHITRTFIRTQFGEIALHLMSMKTRSSKNVLYTEKDLNKAKQYLNASIFPNLSVVAAMIFNGITDPALIRTAYDIGDEITTFNIVVDDWADLYGGVDINQRPDSDIQNGRLTWLLFTAHRIANKEQRLRLMKCYGEKDPASVMEVKAIYSDLNISEIVKEIGEEKGRSLELRISQLPQDTFPTHVYLHILEHYRKVAYGTASRP